MKVLCFIKNITAIDSKYVQHKWPTKLNKALVSKNYYYINCNTLVTVFAPVSETHNLGTCHIP